MLLLVFLLFHSFLFHSHLLLIIHILCLPLLTSSSSTSVVPLYFLFSSFIFLSSYCIPLTASSDHCLLFHFPILCLLIPSISSSSPFVSLDRDGSHISKKRENIIALISHFIYPYASLFHIYNSSLISPTRSPLNFRSFSPPLSPSFSLLFLHSPQ